MSAPYISERTKTMSHCCGAPIMDDSDICTECKEHCEGEEVCPECNGSGRVDEIDESRINSHTIDIPYKKVSCEKCKGEGTLIVEIDL